MGATEKGTAATLAAAEAIANSKEFEGLISYGPGQAVRLPPTEKVRGNALTLAKGAAIAPFTLAPDLLGLAIKGMQGHYGKASKTFNADPIRELVGIDPEDPYGIAGEMLGNWEGAVAKIPAFIGKAITALTDPSAVKGGAILAQSLFHGTPHKFDVFDLQKIGTGEGAQAYGHGLYFAESPGVAKSYQRDLTDFRLELDGKQLFREDAPDELVEVIDWVFQDPRKRGVKAYKEFIEGEEEFASRALDSDDAGVAQMARDIIEENKKRRAVMAKYEGRLKDAEGHLYEVDIPDETIGKMLDWDAPLSEQPKALQDAIANNPEAAKRIRMATSSFGELKGEQIYEVFAQLPSGGMSRDQRAASAMLSEAGIPGIRYYDGASRNVAGGDFLGIEKVDGKFRSKVEIKSNTRVQGAPQTITWSPKFDTEAEAKQWAESKIKKGTRNIVVFNPDDITQVKRDGELVYKTK